MRLLSKTLIGSLCIQLALLHPQATTTTLSTNIASLDPAPAETFTEPEPPTTDPIPSYLDELHKYQERTREEERTKRKAPKKKSALTKCKTQLKRSNQEKTDCTKSNRAVSAALLNCRDNLSNVTMSPPTESRSQVRALQNVSDLNARYMVALEALTTCTNHLKSNTTIMKVTNTTPRPKTTTMQVPQSPVLSPPRDTTVKTRRSTFRSPAAWHQELNQATITFQKKGSLVSEVTFIHLVLDIPMGQLKQQGDEVCKLMSRSVEFDPSVHNLVDDIMRSLIADCKTLISSVDEKISLWFKGTHGFVEARERRDTAVIEQNPRVKRQLMIMAALAIAGGIFTMGSTLFSHTALAKISMGTGTSTTNIKVLQEHEKRVAVNEHSIKLLNESIALLGRNQNTLSKNVDMLHGFHLFEGAFAKIKRQIDHILIGLERLHNHKLSSLLVNPVLMNRLILKTQKEAENLGLQILLKDVEEVYSSEVSYLAFSNYTIRCIIHLPAYKKDSSLTLYEFLPLPMPVSSGKFLSVSPRETFIAISINHQEFKTFTSKQLSLCQTFGSTFHCPSMNIKFRRGYPSCLFSLFDRDEEGVVENCPVRVESKRDLALKYGHNKILVLHVTDQSARLICQNSEVPNDQISFKGFKMLTIPEKCSITTPNFLMESTTNLFLETEELVLEKDLNLSSSMHYSELSTNLDSFLTQLSNVGSTKEVKIKDLNQVFADEHSGLQIKLSFVVGILFLAVGVGLYFCIRKCKSAKTPGVNVSVAPAAPPQQHPLPQIEYENSTPGQSPFENPARTYNKFYRRYAIPDDAQD